MCLVLIVLIKEKEGNTDSPPLSVFLDNPIDVFVTSECIHLYILCIVPQCLFQEVSIRYLSHVMPRCSHREIQ